MVNPSKQKRNIEKDPEKELTPTAKLVKDINDDGPYSRDPEKVSLSIITDTVEGSDKDKDAQAWLTDREGGTAEETVAKASETETSTDEASEDEGSKAEASEDEANNT